MPFCMQNLGLNGKYASVLMESGRKLVFFIIYIGVHLTSIRVYFGLSCIKLLFWPVFLVVWQFICFRPGLHSTSLNMWRLFLNANDGEMLNLSQRQVGGKAWQRSSRHSSVQMSVGNWGKAINNVLYWMLLENSEGFIYTGNWVPNETEDTVLLILPWLPVPWFATWVHSNGRVKL